MSTASPHTLGIMQRLGRLGLAVRLAILLRGGARVGFAAIMAVLASLVLDRWLHLSTEIRTAGLVAATAWLAVLIWRRLLGPAAMPVTATDLALVIERRFPQLAGRCISAVEFAGLTAEASPLRATMMRATMSEAVEGLRGLHLGQVLDRRRIRRDALILGLAAGVAVGWATLAGPSLRLWFQRNVLLADVDWPRQSSLRIEGLTDGRLYAARDDDVTVHVAVEPGFAPPASVELRLQGSGGPRVEQMPATNSRRTRFSLTLRRVEAGGVLTVTGGDAVPRHAELVLRERPEMQSMRIAIAPPEYTRQPAYELRADQSQAQALAGSTLRFEVRSRRPVVRAVLHRIGATDGQELEMAAADALRLSFTAEERPTADTTYELRLTDAHGLTNAVLNRSLPRFSIRLLPDQPPVATLKPSMAVEGVTTRAVLPLEAVVTDQYGVASAAIACRLQRGSNSPRDCGSEPLADLPRAALRIERAVEWAASGRGLAAGDRIELRAVAEDLDDLNGPNRGESAPVSLRIVSAEELLAGLSQRERELRRDYERQTRAQEQLYSDLLGWKASDTAAAAGLARRQRDSLGRLEIVRGQYEQILAELVMNWIERTEVQERLSQGVLAPLGRITGELMPGAAADLEQLDGAAGDPAAALASQAELVAAMNRLLADMLEWEGYDEAVSLLRDIIVLHRGVYDQTREQAAEQLFGPTSAPTSEVAP